MGIQLQFVFTACIVVNILLTFVPVLNEAVLGKKKENFVHLDDDGDIQKYMIRNLFDSVVTNNLKEGETLRNILKYEVEGDQEAFDRMKGKLRITRNRNVDKRNEGENFVKLKREAEEDYDPKTRWRDGRYRDGRDLFQTFNPFNRRAWELRMPKREELNNETYQAAMESVLKLWFQQRYNLNQVLRYRQNISYWVPESGLRIFDDQLQQSQDFIDKECLVIQDILWGEKKEYRTPLDKTLIRRLASEIKMLQSFMEQENLPEALRDCKDEYVQEDLNEIRGYLKKSLKFLTVHYAQIQETIDRWESGTEGAVTPMKWVQMKHW